MTQLSVMTWNIENLFRPQADASQEEQQRYQRKLTLLADNNQHPKPRRCRASGSRRC
jgi:hypothetical protein